MAALAVKKLPEGDEWLYELKWDGYRALLIKDGDDVQIRSRNDKDLTAMYPGIAAAGRRQKIKQIVLDGEIVALGEDGRPSFQALQHRSSQQKRQIVFYVFDLLYADGQDLTGERLEVRRILRGQGVTLRRKGPSGPRPTRSPRGSGQAETAAGSRLPIRQSSGH
jgi:bifunctional non-homologous end joining protein LigD